MKSDNGAPSDASGAAILNSAPVGTAEISNTTFSDNEAVVGGAILNADEMTITGSTFSGNSASFFGGAMFISGNALVSNSTCSNNSAPSGGGGAIMGGASSFVAIVNSTFAGNQSTARGGALLAGSSATLTVTNSTFSGNTTGGTGGGISNDFGATMSARGTIVASEAAGGNCSGTIADAGYNISDDTSCGFAMTGSANNGDGINPMLAAAGLLSNGGPTQTIALMTTSPAINAIPLASCVDHLGDPVTTDQRGFPRPDPAALLCDIGAYELQVPVVCSGAFAGKPTLVTARNSKFIAETIKGVTDDAGPFSIKIDAIRQDEPVVTNGTCPDGAGVGTSTAQVRAERDSKGDGRVYHVSFTATDNGTSLSCSGAVKVCVSRDGKHPACGDGGASFDSTVCP